MKEIARQIQSGDFSMLEENYQELKSDYLALVITVVDILDGTAYLFEKEPPENRRKWKAELKLEQYRHVLGKIIEKEDTIEKKDTLLYDI